LNDHQALTVDADFAWNQLESQFDTASFESLLSTAFSSALWTPVDTGGAVEQIMFVLARVTS
jgi:hypothetical protein